MYRILGINMCTGSDPFCSGMIHIPSTRIDRETSATAIKKPAIVNRGQIKLQENGHSPTPLQQSIHFSILSRWLLAASVGALMAYSEGVGHGIGREDERTSKTAKVEIRAA